MDDGHFDRLTRSLLSRRGVVRSLTGLAGGIGLARGAQAAVGECGAAGSTCDPANPTTCCSNTCANSKRHKNTFRCAPAGSAFGCKKRDNNCAAKPKDVPCPAAPPALGTVCVNDNKGKPLCVTEGVCVDCQRDADCVEAFGVNARCIKKCPSCAHLGATSACVLPFMAQSI